LAHNMDCTLHPPTPQQQMTTFATFAIQNETRPKLLRCDYDGILDQISKLLSEEYFKTYVEMDRTYEQLCSDLAMFKRCEPKYDYSWWEQDEEDWDVYDQSAGPFDHLTEEELEEYFFDRRMTL
jgi:hypothetical protein